MIGLVNARFLLKIKVSQMSCSALKIHFPPRGDLIRQWCNKSPEINKTGVGGGKGGGGLSAFSYNLTIAFL